MKERVKVKVINNSKSLNNPKYETSGSDAVDLMACYDCGEKVIRYRKDNSEEIIDVNKTTSLVLYPSQRMLIPTGLKMEVPEGFRFQIYSRSGLSLKSGIVVANSPGKVDSDYRGSVGVILLNVSDKPFRINHGDRIAQGSIEESIQLEWTDEKDLSKTKRGEGGFGHTGVESPSSNEVTPDDKINK